MFGTYFETATQEHTLDERLIVDKAIDFLAPFFGINLDDDEKWDSITLPEIRVGEPRYNSERNLIYLPSGIKERNGSVGHEVGHWYHHVVNPDVFPKQYNPSREPFRHSLIETVADYTAVIYIDGRSPFKTPEFALLELAKMSYESSLGLAKRINDFHMKLIHIRGAR